MWISLQLWWMNYVANIKFLESKGYLSVLKRALSTHISALNEIHWMAWLAIQIINICDYQRMAKKTDSSWKSSRKKNRKHSNLTIQTLHILLICMPMANAHNFNLCTLQSFSVSCVYYYYSNFLPLHFKSFFWLILCVVFLRID